MNRRDFLATLAASALASQVSQRPNIVFILADDLGYGDLGCYGQRLLATPNIDKLAAEGIRFTQAYAGAAVCAPSRCCLMTGMHTGHSRVRGNHGAHGERVPLQPDDTTVAEVLKQAGYYTGAIGKWGLGEAGTLGIPNAKGFDEWYGFLNQDHALGYYPTHLWRNQSEYFPPGNQGAKRKEYAQDLFTTEALGFIERNRSRSFFLYLAYTVPHADSERGRDTGDGFVVPDYQPYESKDWPRPEKGFAAMTARLDRDVGCVMDQLKRLGIDSNTIVFFASDNGPAVDGGHTPKFFASDGGLRGHKSDLYEGGIRVPMIARWPGRTPAGRVSDVAWAFWDVLPTLAELAGARAPKSIDGVSVVPALFGRPQSPHDYLYWESHEHGFSQAVRMDRWKAVVSSGKKLELYDLSADPRERRDIAGTQPEVRGAIEKILRTARSDSDQYPVHSS